MKKFDLLKVLGITLLIVALISWVVPAGIYSKGAFSSLESTIPIGLYDLFRLPYIAIATFIQFGLLFLAIGGFYGVLNKTGVYSKLVDALVEKVRNKNVFLIITILIFALLTSFVGSPNLIFILVPFFVAVLIKLGYSKMTAFAATVGAMLIGQIGTTFGFSTWGYLKYVFGVEMHSLIFERIILLVIVLFLFILLVRKLSIKEISTKPSKKQKNKEEIKEEKIDIPLHKDTTSKKSFMPLVVMSILTFVIAAVGVYNWYYAFEIDFFTTLHDSIVSFEFGGQLILKNILGSVTEIGFFGNYDLMVILLISSFIIGWIYGLKINDIFDGLKSGFKEMLKPALYSMLACTVFTALLNMSSSGGDFVYTIIDKFISDSGQFSLAGTIGSGLISSFAYNDFYTLAANLAGIFGSYDAEIIPAISFIIQTMYSLVMVIAPTSIFLIAGLSYLDIPYKEWVKYIWKLLLAIFGIIVVIAFIITAMI